MRDNRPVVEGMLKAFFDGGDQVRANASALKFAAKVSAAVYNESDGAYWEKYYNGVSEKDKKGLQVDLGGSAVNNLGDNLLLFGMSPGSANLFAATYKVFGDIVVSQYPSLVPNYPAVSEILDTSYIASIAGKTTTITEGVKPKFNPAAPSGSVVSRRSWHITFDTGRATFSPDAARDLDQMLRDLLVAGNTIVEVHGHTDSVGTPESNMTLSEARAFAVKQWLEQQSPVNFPNGRIRVTAHGQQNPVAPNTTPEGRAQNRRVEIVLTTSGGD
jgi:outer membrane protein OmpA-like peptidoglycan-associated protein